MADTKIWLEVALNGPFTRRVQPRIPIAPEEIIAEGIACAEAGAAIVHVHAYDPDTGRQKDDAGVYARIIREIRGRTGAIVYPTLSLAGDVAERYAPIEELGREGLLEWSVVDPGSVNITLHSEIEADENGILYANPDAHIRRGLQLAEVYGFHPSFAIYEPGFARAGAAWSRRYPRIGQPVYRLMFSDRFTFGFPPDEYALAAYRRLLDTVAPGAPWMIAGLGVDIRPMIGQALALGGHVRVGLEDAPPDCPESNVELVASAAAAIAGAGRALAGPDEIRAALGDVPD